MVITEVISIFVPLKEQTAIRQTGFWILNIMKKTDHKD